MYSRLSISYLYTLEMFDEDRCKVVAMIIMSINNSLSCLMATYLMLGGRDATIYLLAGNLIVLYSLAFTPILPESPKLLYSLKKYEKVRQVLSKIASFNGVTYNPVEFTDEVKDRQGVVTKTEQLQIVETRDNKGFLELLVNPKFLLNMCLVVYVYMFNVFSMYMISFMIKYLPGDKYMNLFVLGVADFIPSLISGAVLTMMPTKRGMIIMHIMICGFTLAHIMFGGIEYLGMPLIFFVRFFITLES